MGGRAAGGVRRAALGAALLAASAAASAAPGDAGKALIWSLLPGGGHFYLGETGTGIAYATSIGAFLLAGAEVQRRNDELGNREDEYIAPAIVGQKLWEFSFFTAYRSGMRKEGMDLRGHGFDDTPASDLLLAPFHYENWLDPWVFGAGLLGGALAAAGSGDGEPGMDDISRVGIWGQDYNRRDGTAAYGVSAMAISLGAGVAEEALFRGLMQPILQEHLGPGRGLLIASGVFGLAHIVGPDGRPNPAAVASATAAGLYLGWLYNENGNRLARPIAAHYWYNFMLMAVSWVMDPEDNALGVEVEFAF